MCLLADMPYFLFVCRWHFFCRNCNLNYKHIQTNVSNCVLTDVSFGSTLTAPPIPLLLVLVLNFSPRLYLHFQEVSLLGMIPICCSRMVVIIFSASTPIVAGKGCMLLPKLFAAHRNIKAEWMYQTIGNPLKDKESKTGVEDGVWDGYFIFSR